MNTHARDALLSPERTPKNPITNYFAVVGLVVLVGAIVFGYGWAVSVLWSSAISPISALQGIEIVVLEMLLFAPLALAAKALKR